MYLFILLLVVCVVLLFMYNNYTMNYWKRRNILHEKPHFIYGNTRTWSGSKKHLIDILSPMYRKYKKATIPYVGFYFLRRRAVIALDVEFIKNVLIKDFNVFHERGIYFNERDDPLTGHLFRLGGEKWRPLRQKLSPTFSSGKMKHMFPIVFEIGEEFRRVLSERLSAVDNQRGVLEITDLMGRFTADVIGTCAFGLDCNSMRDPQAEFVVMGNRSFTTRRHGSIMSYLIETYPNLAKKLRLKNIPLAISDFYFRIVRETIAHRLEQNIKRNDFMNMLIEMLQKKEITVEEITAQSFIFFIAGFHTSSQTLSFALYELAKRPDIQDRLRAEINAVYKRHNQEFTYECMADMDYLEQVIAETLRKYPILPHLLRQAQADYLPPGVDKKYFVEKGTNVYIPVYGIHYDEEYYPDAERFDPDRFKPEAIKLRPACTWLPFGDGPRNCIGLRFGKMQAAIGLFFMIKYFKFNICPETEIPLKFQVNNTLLTPVNGIYLNVEEILVN